MEFFQEWSRTDVRTTKTVNLQIFAIISNRLYKVTNINNQTRAHLHSIVTKSPSSVVLLLFSCTLFISITGGVFKVLEATANHNFRY